jgi:hypothetical protein
VIWKNAQGLQGELTLYGSGRVIVLSERGALTPTPPGGSPPTTVAALSEEGTAQAETVLHAFFQAWAAKDMATYKSLMTEERGGGYRTFGNLERVVFGAVMAWPEWVDSWLRGGDRGVARDDVRIFRGPVTFYVKEGTMGSEYNGEELFWEWDLVRGPDGKWRVAGWGF